MKYFLFSYNSENPCIEPEYMLVKAKNRKKAKRKGKKHFYKKAKLLKTL